LEKDIAEGLLYAIQLSPWWWWVIKHQLGEHQTGGNNSGNSNAEKLEKEPGKNYSEAAERNVRSD
jgi:hypothetical protein